MKSLRNKNNRPSQITCILLASFALCLTVSAQITRGSLSGNVTDPTGALLTNANVQLKNPANGEEVKTVTDTEGEFVFPSLAIGNYALTVEATGFKRVVIQSVVIEVATPARLSVALAVGEISEVITVTNAQELVNTTSPSLTNIVERRQVQDLPLATRNPIELAKLQAGVSIPSGTDLNTAIISGLRGSTSNLTHDGINVMDNFVKTGTFTNVTSPSVEATAEFAISTGTISSDTGRGVGQVKIVTPSGTNQFHGGLFEFHRNAALNANNFISNSTNTPRPFQIQNRFGFTASGPVWLPKKVFGPASYDGRNRSFWFLSHEGYREPFSTVRTRLVLTPEARQGQFRYQGADGQQKTVNLFTIGNLKTANPFTQALIGKTPLPNSTFSGDGLNTASYRYNVKAMVNNSKWSGRFDQVLTESARLGTHKLEFVYHNTNYLTTPDLGNGREAPFPGGINGIIYATVNMPIVALHSSFGARATNEVRFGRQNSPIAFSPEKPQPQKFFVALASVTSPEFFISDAPRNTTVGHFQDHFSFVKGSQTMRLGAEYQSITWTDAWNGGILPTIRLGSNAANPDGIFNSIFPSLPAGATGTAIANRARASYYDLTGALGSISQSFNVTSPTSGYVPGAPATAPIRQRDLGLYWQDQWRARRNLTLNYGLRWEFIGVPHVTNGLVLTPTNGIDGLFGISGRNNLFNPGVLKGTAPTLLDFGGADKGRPYYKNDWNNFAPFIGLAYSPRFARGPLRWLFGEAGRSAIRGGFSISYPRDGLAVGLYPLTTNAGLNTFAFSNVLTGALPANGITLPPPAFKTPISDLENFQINTGSSLSVYDPNLRSPYVQQWSFGLQREIVNNFALEVRYVGNHAVKLYRTYDINEINIFENGFLQEFLNAQKNLALNNGTSFAPGAAGTVPLPIFSALFTGLPATQGFASTGLINSMNFGNVASIASTLAVNPVYAANRTRLAPNFFRANPNTNQAVIVGNGSYSMYHSLQLEVRRRFSNGLLFQTNYTFGKTITDSEGSATDFEAFRTLRNLRLDRHRAYYDVTHNIVGNFIYELPVGPKRRFWNGGPGVLRKALEGWQVQGIVTWHSGFPTFATSGRTTFNNYTTNNPAQLLGMSFADFKKNIGVFRRPEGIFYFNPDLLNITRASNGQLLTATLKDGILGPPPPGQFGNFPRNAMNSPSFFQMDAGIIKRTRIREVANFEFRAEFFNVFNAVNFGSSSLLFDSARFGQIQGAYQARLGQLSVRVNW